MEREIEFRAKAVNRVPGREYRTSYKNGDWVFGLLTKHMKVFPNGAVLNAEMTNVYGIENIEVDEGTLGQYTGLKDKTGQKIYDGDIVALFQRTQVFIVKYCNERCGYFLDDVVLCGGAEPGVECLGNMQRTIEIIGNIYDNPDLAKEVE